ERVSVSLAVGRYSHIQDGRHTRCVARGQGRNQFPLPRRKLKPVKRRGSFVVVINIDRSSVSSPGNPDVLGQPAWNQAGFSGRYRIQSAPLAQIAGKKCSSVRRKNVPFLMISPDGNRRRHGAWSAGGNILGIHLPSVTIIASVINRFSVGHEARRSGFLNAVRIYLLDLSHARWKQSETRQVYSRGVR